MGVPASKFFLWEKLSYERQVWMHKVKYFRMVISPTFGGGQKRMLDTSRSVKLKSMRQMYDLIGES